MSVLTLVSRPTTKTEVLSAEFKKLHHQYPFLYQNLKKRDALPDVTGCPAHLAKFQDINRIQTSKVFVMIFGLQIFVPALNLFPLAAGWENSDG